MQLKHYLLHPALFKTHLEQMFQEILTFILILLRFDRTAETLVARVFVFISAPFSCST